MEPAQKQAISQRRTFGPAGKEKEIRPATLETSQMVDVSRPVLKATSCKVVNKTCCAIKILAEHNTPQHSSSKVEPIVLKPKRSISPIACGTKSTSRIEKKNMNHGSMDENRPNVKATTYAINKACRSKKFTLSAPSDRNKTLPQKRGPNIATGIALTTTQSIKPATCVIKDNMSVNTKSSKSLYINKTNFLQDKKKIYQNITFKRISSKYDHIVAKVDTNLHPITKTIRRMPNTIVFRKMSNDDNHASGGNANTISRAKEEELGAKTNKHPGKLMDGVRHYDYYNQDYHDYLRQQENKSALREHFLANMQISEVARAKLLNLLIHIHTQLKWSQQTLYRTISIMDRFLQKAPDVEKDDFRLLGLASMVVSYKYEEAGRPAINSFVSLSGNAFTAEQIFLMERIILPYIKYDLSPPHAFQFLELYTEILQSTAIQKLRAQLFTELMLLDYSTCAKKPSQISATAVCMVLALTRKDIIHPKDYWSKELRDYSGYEFKDIELLFAKLAGILSKPPDIYTKGVLHKYSGVGISESALPIFVL